MVCRQIALALIQLILEDLPRCRGYGDAGAHADYRPGHLLIAADERAARLRPLAALRRVSHADVRSLSAFVS
jgi:hypothetical protein